MRVKFCINTQLERVFFSPFFLSWLGSLYSFFAHVCVFLVQHCMILLELACEQAVCLGKKKIVMKGKEGGGGRACRQTLI